MNNKDNLDKTNNNVNNNSNNEPNNESNNIYDLENNFFSKENRIQRFIKKLLLISNIEGNIIKIFGIDKLCILILVFVKNILVNKIPKLNKYIFKEKTASLTISYTHFTSSYYNQQTSSTDYIVYKSILCYVLDKKPIGCKFISNTGSNLMFFDQFEEIQLNKKICLASKNTSTNTSTVYTLELSSYVSNINEINKFIKYCVEQYKTQIQSESIVSSGLKYYKYLGMNNSSHQCMFEEYPFTQTKTFSNIFFVDKDSLVHKIKYFTSNESTYKLIGRPYTMGIMLYGKPGTGKTSCIKAIASLTQRHIIDVSLKKIKSQKELSEIFYSNKINGIEVNMKNRLYVLEEFDCIIEKLKDRKLNQNMNIANNINKQQTNNEIENNLDEINLESLLCLLDGTVELCGSMFVATTNYIDLIDKALIRPGRFDCCIEFDNANWEIIIQIINHFSKKNIKKLKDNKSSTIKSTTYDKLTPIQIDEIKKYSIYNDKLVWSPAKISQICLFHIDSPTYFSNVINDLKKQYKTEIKLLE